MYNLNSVGTVESFWKLVSKDRFPKLKDIALNAFDVWKHIRV